MKFLGFYPMKMFAAVCIGMACFWSASHAQTFSMDWYTFDGGGTSTGGVYLVSGTIGQPDAGTMNGGTYSLSGGFWSIYAIQTPGAPFLEIQQMSNRVMVSWLRPASGYVLQETPNRSGAPWANVAFPYATNSTHISVTVTNPISNRFYRLIKF